MNIEDIISAILKKEGGYVNHPADKGGPTKYGITQRTLSNWLGRAVSAEDVRAMTLKTAKEIYYRNFYLKPGINELPVMLQAMMTDMVVNHGPKAAIVLLQNELTLLDFEPGKVDGIIGPKTCRAALLATQKLGNAFIDRLIDRRVALFNALVIKDPSQKVFEKGWLARAESFRPNKQA
jgi:lysozyme family protein